MITESEIRKMPIEEKLRIFEAIWADLSRHADSVESPDWHRSELEATERRRVQGLEVPMDWDQAKQKLRNREDGI
jgi:hypothetical protein